jgi:hypothetical protein
MRYFVHVDCVKNYFFLLNKSANAACLFIHVLFRNRNVIVKKSFLVSSFDIVTLYCERSKFSWLILSTIMVIVLWIIQFHDCA